MPSKLADLLDSLARRRADEYQALVDLTADGEVTDTTADAAAAIIAAAGKTRADFHFDVKERCRDLNHEAALAELPAVHAEMDEIAAARQELLREDNEFRREQARKRGALDARAKAAKEKREAAERAAARLAGRR
jgi:hypothetical protein